MKFAVSINSRAENNDLLDYLSHRYVPFLEHIGIVPVLIPNNLSDPGAFLAALAVDGLVLTGGGDLDPALYGQPDKHAVRIMAGRDHTEFALLDWVTARDLPVLAICRGVQVLNVYFGGELLQDIPAELGAAVDHDDTTHPVQILDERIAALLDVRELITNSHHHQGFTAGMLAPDLAPFAISEPDGVIEGVLHRALPVLGVQWHPERPSPSREHDLKLFRHFVQQGAFWLA